ncbi:MAG: DUF2868 domain-containing protein [Epsilonproteobacteria bacterium]|nr:DUF2868 domain-containing protein [Campylobacterota bacterium]
MDIRTYFALANSFLEAKQKNYNDFVRYIHNNDLSFHSAKELAQEFFLFLKQEDYPLINSIQTNSKIFIGISFLIGFLLGVIFFQKTININLFLIISVVLPLFFMIFSGFRIVLYRFPLKKESLFFERFLPKGLNIQDEDTHVLKVYSFLVLQKAAIGYALGILLSTMFLFFVNQVDFNYDNTYNLSEVFEQQIIDFFSILWSWVSPELVPDISNIQHQRSTFAIFMLLSILLWNIFPRILLLFIAYQKYLKAIDNALEVKTKELRTILENSVAFISQPKHTSMVQNMQKSQNRCKELHGRVVYKLFYEMEPLEIDLNDKALEGKIERSFAVATFDMDEQEEEKIIHQLENLVIIFPSPQTLPDESFKSFVKRILQNSHVIQIWIAVTIEQDHEIKLALKTDPYYDEWRYQINEVLDDLRIRLYHER